MYLNRQWPSGKAVGLYTKRWLFTKLCTKFDYA